LKVWTTSVSSLSSLLTPRSINFMVGLLNPQINIDLTSGDNKCVERVFSASCVVKNKVRNSMST
jgi:hypothetical protein